jgi:hypothetical protein
MPHDPRDIKLDVTGVSPAPASQPAAPQARPFLSVQFACCSVYQRVYRDPDGLHYTGRCPRCGKAVRFAVGEGGTSARAFVVR